MERTDILSEADIRSLIKAFYGHVLVDPLIGHFFTGIDLDAHLPRLWSFWEMILFGTPGYATNVADVHIQLNARMPMEPVHFERWLALFEGTVADMFSGPKADEALQRARSIAMVMRMKIEGK